MIAGFEEAVLMMELPKRHATSLEGQPARASGACLATPKCHTEGHWAGSAAVRRCAVQSLAATGTAVGGQEQTLGAMPLLEPC